MCHTGESQAMPPACSPAPSLPHQDLWFQSECLLWSLEASSCVLGLFLGLNFLICPVQVAGDPIN